MKKDRRNFIKKSLIFSGLVFSGIEGVSCVNESVNKQKNEEKSKTVKHWDVIVIGGGPGGVPAAVSAARNGASVLLIERYGFLGGMATAGLVNPYMPYKEGDIILNRGLFEEFIEIMKKEGALLKDGIHFDAEPMKWLLDNFCKESGVDLLMHTNAIGVLKDDDKIKAVRVFHKGGVEDLSAEIFIDSTGDGDIAAWGGAEIKIGRKEDNACQPMTTSFRMADVKIDEMPAYDEINRLYDEAKEKGEVDNPRENVLKFITVHPDAMHFNTTRIVGRSALDGWSLTEAEIEGRRQVDQMVRFLKKYIKGFENAYLMKIAPQIGIRESRRVMGEYLLTADDVLAAKHFKDGIASSSYNIDIHNPTGTGTVHKRLEPGTFYQIPYRCIIPKKIKNLLIASRCISADHAAHSSLRIMPVVWALGQAAGTASSLCIKNNNIPNDVNTNKLLKTLKDQGAFIL